MSVPAFGRFVSDNFDIEFEFRNNLEEYKSCIFLDLSIGCRAGFVVFIVMETFTYQMEETVWIVTDAIIVSTASMVMGTWNVSPARYSS